MDKISIYFITTIFLFWVVFYFLVDMYIRHLSSRVIRCADFPSMDKAVCLTFDDGPSEVTSKVLDILQQKEVKATFFLVGERAREYPELLQRMIDEGHEIGVHMYQHRHAYLLSPLQSIANLCIGKRTLEDLSNRPVHYFRPPWGAFNLFSWLTAHRLKLQPVLWSIEAHDWELKTGSAGICRRILDNAQPNMLIVLHDAGGEIGAPENTRQALSTVIDELHNRGYKFVKLNSVLAQREVN